MQLQWQNRSSAASSRERDRVVLQFLSLSLVPSPVSDAPIMTPVLYFISHLCFSSAGDTLFVAGLDSFL